ncbi:hypothetical protein D9757_013754 [Collybiopsis confluens]|uniref:Uncharacterized protein n=1 Tax=Collybiopsis confluens TaxID=2823264 RepID=A0A8H5D258_9AGAR|nr:hypothetical protein D9757_013754 [Collybiopsis confluens]
MTLSTYHLVPHLDLFVIGTRDQYLPSLLKPLLCRLAPLPCTSAPSHRRSASPFRCVRPLCDSCLMSLGDICRMEHNFDEARTMLSDAKAAFEQIGDHLGQASCLWSLGDICRMEHNFSAAWTILSDANTAFEQIGYQLGQAKCLQSLGDVCRMEHNYPAARKMFSDAKVVFEQIGNQWGIGECLQHLENISRMENNIPPHCPTSKNKQIPNLKDALKGLNISHHLFHRKKFKTTKQAK